MSGSSSGDDRPLKSEEVIALVINRGLTIADLDKMTYGMLINYACAYDRQKLIAAGKQVVDPEVKYEELKANLPIIEERYKAGTISKERYEKYVAKIKKWEVN